MPTYRPLIPQRELIGEKGEESIFSGFTIKLQHHVHQTGGAGRNRTSIMPIMIEVTLLMCSLSARDVGIEPTSTTSEAVILTIVLIPNMSDR